MRLEGNPPLRYPPEVQQLSPAPPREILENKTMDKKIFTVTGQGIVLMIFGIVIGIILALALLYLGVI